MRIAVVGAGAIGGAIAHALTRAGADPVLVARGASAAAIARDGLRFDEAGRSETSRPRVVEDPRGIAAVDAVIGTMKAQDWPAALPLIAPLLGPSTLLLPAINGIPWWYFQGEGGSFDGRRLASVDPDGALADAIAADRVVGTVVYMATSRPAPGHVVSTRARRLVLGPAADRPRADWRPLLAALREAGFAAEETPDIRRATWAKLLGNVGFNPISALTRTTMAEIVDDPDLNALCADAIRETLAIARAAGRPLDVTAEARIAEASRLGHFRTSMLQDMDAGRALEIGGLLDAPVEIGALVGVDAPVLRSLARLLRAAAARRA
jgi:2-dehydropantoate 2-reductase